MLAPLHLLLKRYLLSRSPQPSAPRTDQGLTLLECLMAVAVITITAAMITPPLFLAAATRQQNRRAEQAFQTAQGEVDRIRALVALGQHTPDHLPSTVAVTALSGVGAPTGISNYMRSNKPSCNTYNEATNPLLSTQLLKVDIDGDCQTDFFVQEFRTPGTASAEEKSKNPANPRPSSFQLGVRVYSALIANGNTLKTPLSTQPASLQFTSATGFQSSRPLAVIYTPFSWSDRSSTLCDYLRVNNPGAFTANCGNP